MTDNPISTAFIALLAPIVLMLTGMIVLLLGVRKNNQQGGLVSTVAVIGSLGSGVIAATNLVIRTIAPTTLPQNMPFGGGMVNDSLGAFFNLALALSALLAVLMAGRYLAERHLPAGDFYALVLFSASGGMVMAQAFDLVNIFVGLEVLSVALYILAGFARRDLRSEEAAVKYFLLGAFTSAFLLFGCALVYGAVGITIKANGFQLDPAAHSYTNLFTIATTLSATKTMAMPLATNPLFVAGAVFIIIGLCFKASIVPFHSYAPDVYEGSPIPVTAFMSAAAKAGAFAAFLRWFIVLLDGSSNVGPYRNLLWILAAATILVGNVLAVRQTAVKRMLAYSSIAHAGYLLVGLLASAPANGKILTDQTMVLAQSSIGYYVLVYTFMNLGAFAVLAWIGNRNGQEYTQISDLAGLAKREPLAAGIMAIFLLSLAGIPPLAGFFGKLYVFLAALNSGYAGLTALGLVASVIGAFYYLNLIVSMYFREGNGAYVRRAVGGGAKVAAVISAIATLVLGIVPIKNVTPSLKGAFVETDASTASRPVGGMQPVPAPNGAPVTPSLQPVVPTQVAPTQVTPAQEQAQPIPAPASSPVAAP